MTTTAMFGRRLLPRSGDSSARLPNPRGIVAGINASTKRDARHLSGSSSELSSPDISPKTPTKPKRVHHADEEYDEDSSTTDEEMDGKDGLAVTGGYGWEDVGERPAAK